MAAKMTQKIAKWIMAACLLIILSNIVLSFGVGPSRQYLSYEPGKSIKGELTVINDGAEDFKAAIYAQGDLAEYVNITRPLMDISALESTKQAPYEIIFPDKSITPGEHKLELIVRQFPAESKSREGVTISASTAVIAQIIVKAQYPGKYAEGKLFISGAETNESPATFVVMLYNFGTDDISNAHAKVEVFGPTWEKIAQANTENFEVKSKQEAKLETRWQPDVNKGTYHAVVTVNYDGNEFKLEQNFDVGTFMIDVSDISVKKFTLGDVAKFDINLYNSWNTEINDVFVEMTVEDSTGKRMTEFKTAAISIPAQKDGALQAYWYTEGVMPGTYKVRLIIHYAGKLVQKEYDFEVSTNSITKLGMVGQAVTAEEIKDISSKGTIILLIIITLVLLIGMNLLWFYKLSKLMKGRTGGQQ